MTKEFVLYPVAFTLGAISVQPNRSLNFFVLYKMLERVFRSSNDLKKRFEDELKAYAQSRDSRIFIAGNPQVPISCEFLLSPGLPISTSCFADMADSFILGVLVRHHSPLVQVSEVRQRVEFLWRFPVVRNQFYDRIEDLIQSGLVVIHDRTEDTDQRFMSLPDDALLLGEMLATR